VVLARTLVRHAVAQTARVAGQPQDIPLPGVLRQRRVASGVPGKPGRSADIGTGFPDLGTGFHWEASPLTFSTELRFPLFGQNIGGVLFQDAGNVYSSLQDISFRVRQRDKTDFNYMVHAAGFGVLYKTPVGPVRLDFSLSPNSPRYFGCDGTISELVTKGCLSTTDQRINRFQFHFSLGQTF
jgi:hypothetical protein